MQVYIVTNDLNGKAYVGACAMPLDRRWSGHLSWARKGRGYSLHAAMREHGIEHFHISRVWSGMVPKAKLKRLEEYFIKSFQTMVPNGYNETIGGTTRIFQPCAAQKKEKISKTLKGHPVSDETRAKISERTKIGMARRMQENPWR
jgi:group I intron endonuclease